MDTVPDWLQQLMSSFGERFGLPRFGLNDQGVAGFSVENGCTYRFEYREGSLYMSGMFPLGSVGVESLLSSVHPRRRLPFMVHACCHSGSGQGVYLVRASTEAMTLPGLVERFECLWGLVQQMVQLGSH